VCVCVLSTVCILKCPKENIWNNKLAGPSTPWITTHPPSAAHSCKFNNATSTTTTTTLNYSSRKTKEKKCKSVILMRLPTVNINRKYYKTCANRRGNKNWRNAKGKWGFLKEGKGKWIRLRIRMCVCQFNGRKLLPVGVAHAEVLWQPPPKEIWNIYMNIFIYWA